MLFNLAVLFGTLVAMEGVGTLAHKYIMHGWGWWLHRSHHEPQLGMLETNDLYLVALGLIATALVALGKSGYAPLQWVGGGVAGMACCMCWPMTASFTGTGRASHGRSTATSNACTGRIGCTMR
jgi:hypothetical protein